MKEAIDTRSESGRAYFEECKGRAAYNDEARKHIRLSYRQRRASRSIGTRPRPTNRRIKVIHVNFLTEERVELFGILCHRHQVLNELDDVLKSLVHHRFEDLVSRKLIGQVDKSFSNAVELSQLLQPDNQLICKISLSGLLLCRRSNRPHYVSCPSVRPSRTGS